MYLQYMFSNTYFIAIVMNHIKFHKVIIMKNKACTWRYIYYHVLR